jgi:hypothetical protein
MAVAYADDDQPVQPVVNIVTEPASTAKDRTHQDKGIKQPPRDQLGLDRPQARAKTNFGSLSSSPFISSSASQRWPI